MSFLVYNKNIDVIRTIRLIVPAQNATISPPIGPILGQFGINIMDFCKQYNDLSKFIDLDVLTIVNVYLFRNKNFYININMPMVSFLILEDNFFLEDDILPKYINLSSLLKIIKIKKYSGFLSINDYKSFLTIIGTIRSMNLKICNDI